MQSEEKTARAVGMPRRSCSSCSVCSGGPSRRIFSRYEADSGMSSFGVGGMGRGTTARGASVSVRSWSSVIAKARTSQKVSTERTRPGIKNASTRPGRGSSSRQDRPVRARGTGSSPIAGLATGVGLVAAITVLALPFRDHVNSATAGLLLIVPGMVVALLAGRRAALGTALVATFVVNLAFLEPYGTLKIKVVDDAIALVVFGVVAFTMATLVSLEHQRRDEAEARTAEVVALSD